MATTKRRIHSKGRFTYDEANTGAADIQPGMLVKKNSDGEIVVHATEGGFGEKCIVSEDALQGKTVADVYTSGDLANYIIPEQGGEVNILIQAGQDIAEGDDLISAGDGTFKAADDISSGGTVQEILFTAAEDCDLTDSGAVATLCAARAR